MAAQDGSLMTLAIGNGASPEVFTVIAGLLNTAISLNEELVDTSDKSSPDKFRELERFGVKTVQYSGDGNFRDDAAIEAARANYDGNTKANWQLFVPDYGTFQGAFVINNLELSGPDKDKTAFSITIESGGTVTFTPV